MMSIVPSTLSNGSFFFSYPEAVKKSIMDCLLLIYSTEGVLLRNNSVQLSAFKKQRRKMKKYIYILHN